MKKTLLLLFILSFPMIISAQTVSTFSGGGAADAIEGVAVGTESKFNRPGGLCSDVSGNIYVADTENHRIRKISSSGIVSTIAGGAKGFADGQGIAALFNSPSGICIDKNGILYVADSENRRIRKITPDGMVSTLAGSVQGSQDGLGTAASFDNLSDLCLDNSGNLYVADRGNSKIRKISPAGAVTTVALSEKIDFPRGICMDQTGNLYVTTAYSIKKISTSNVVSNIAGSIEGYADGTGAAAMFDELYGIDIDSEGNLFTADSQNNRIRKITPSGTVSTFAGTGYSAGFDDIGTKAGLDVPQGIHIAADGIMYVADTWGHTIRKITKNGTVSTYAGSVLGFADGLRKVARFSLPEGICIDKNGNLFVAETGGNRIRKITPDGITSTIAGPSDFSGNSTRHGYADLPGSAARFDGPTGICLDKDGNLYITDAYNFKIRKITPSGTVSTLAGSTQGYQDGPGATAKFSNGINGICADKNGNIYVADNDNYRIRKITPDGTVSTLAGSTFGFADGTGSSAKIWQPKGMCIDSNDNLYVVDRINQKIRKITPSGVVSTFAGSTDGYTDGPAATAQFSYPERIGIDLQDNLYVSDYSNTDFLIRKITPAGMVSTVAGSTIGFKDGPAAVAQFNNPFGICSDAAGNLYVADSGNGRIRKITQGTLGTETYSKADFLLKAYPNPTASVLNIELEDMDTDAEITLTDVLGRIVHRQTVRSFKTSINTNHFAKGLYFLTLTKGHEKTSRKIIFE
ncbi:SMP-30/gluconolactonase/LRE family protein [Flavobacterium sp. DG2-3]|uniref:SMP-30/gluconolactonase/LRE family protein n=1 Tax=Flavobacterium sp. DG2-3 TaxID=3068317 RepID=UPI00273E75A3|nr:SMP-30/gluconolactonase/LRE family protein [Flavobacterium sp. DG2-3]MDP5201865.1 SMP-30/gluconolactonase/LRE family protein [Flavobacterium sp. DG2-3]